MNAHTTKKGLSRPHPSKEPPFGVSGCGTRHYPFSTPLGEACFIHQRRGRGVLGSSWDEIPKVFSIPLLLAWLAVERASPPEKREEGGVVERQIINPWRWQDEYGFVQATEASNAQRVLYCAGQVSVDGEGNPLHPGTWAPK